MFPCNYTKCIGKQLDGIHGFKLSYDDLSLPVCTALTVISCDF